MRTVAVLLGLALVVVAVQARHFTDKSENEKRADDELSENIEPAREYRNGPTRHRRKRWQMNYGYDYFPPSPSIAYDRRDYERNQELIPQIWRLLDEISAYVRRPSVSPVMPQPIYVPYPVPYPVPQNCTCNVRLTPQVKSRFPELEDPNQNWGMTVTTNDQDDYEDDGSDGSRPINFDAIKPKTPMKRPQPDVEHGSEQATSDKEERIPTTPKGTTLCNAAILTCCNEESKQQQKACFTRLGCAMTYTRKDGCSKQSVAAAIEVFRSTYSPS